MTWCNARTMWYQSARHSLPAWSSFRLCPMGSSACVRKRGFFEFMTEVKKSKLAHQVRVISGLHTAFPVQNSMQNSKSFATYSLVSCGRGRRTSLSAGGGLRRFLLRFFILNVSYHSEQRRRSCQIVNAMMASLILRMSTCFRAVQVCKYIGEGIEEGSKKANNNVL